MPALDLDPIADDAIPRSVSRNPASLQTWKANALATQQQQDAQTAEDQKQLANTAVNDASQWAQGPQYRDSSFDQAPPEARSHFIDAYGGLGQTAWNQAQIQHGQQNQAIAGQAQQIQQQQDQQLSHTLSNDVPKWVSAYKGTAYGDAPPEVQQSFSDRYGDIVGQVPAAWNQAQTQMTGQPVGDAKVRSGLEKLAATHHIDPTLYPDNASLQQAVANAPVIGKVPAKLQNDAQEMGVYQDGMTPQQVSDAVTTREQEGVIRASSRPFIEQFSQHMVKSPVMLNYAKQREAYDTVKTGLEDSSGLSDKAAIEGLQRLLNPGASVRQGTMNMLLGSQGIAGKFDLDYWGNKIQTGGSFTPEARKEIQKISDSILKRGQATAGQELAAQRNKARMYGIPNPDAFVNGVLSLAAQGEQPQTQSTPQNNPVAAPTAEALKPGDVRKGFRFVGGNPADQNSWKIAP